MWNLRSVFSICTLALAAVAAPLADQRRVVAVVDPARLHDRSSSSAPGLFASNWGTSQNNYPIILVHGIFGWGESPLLGFLRYWGGVTSDLIGTLRDNGFTVAAPALGPVSSHWERACELYAQLVGTRVDYGIVRSSRYGHNRFGEDFTGKALYPNFMSSPDAQINLISHSMGGPTARMFIHLMRYGYEEELDACIAANVQCSTLFHTNRTKSYVNALGSISGALRGTPFDDQIADSDTLSKFVLGFVEALVGADRLTNNLVYDFKLDHWGLKPQPGEAIKDFITRIFASPWSKVKSNALSDLSVAGTASPLLSWVLNDPATYYFSIAGRSTFTFLGTDYADVTTLVFFIPIANLIGSYENASIGVDASWHPNDGIIPIVSATADNANGHVDYPIDLRLPSSLVTYSAPNSPPATGRFHFLQLFDGTDHLGIICTLSIIPGACNRYFINLAGLLTSV